MYSIQFPGARAFHHQSAAGSFSQTNINQVNKPFSGMRALLNKIVTSSQEFESSFHRGSGVAQGNASRN